MRIVIGNSIKFVLNSNVVAGKVIAITDEPGKHIGVEMDANVFGHSCDGRGKHGCCLWIDPSQVVTGDKVTNIAKRTSSSAYSEIIIGTNGFDLKGKDAA